MSAEDGHLARRLRKQAAANKKLEAVGPLLIAHSGEVRPISYEGVPMSERPHVPEVLDQWRTTGGRPLDRKPSGPIEHHECGCVTGWDDTHEQCVLRRCEPHR